MEQVRHGFINKAKISSFEVPSGVSKVKVTTNRNGKKITYKDISFNNDGIRKNIKCNYL